MNKKLSYFIIGFSFIALGLLLVLPKSQVKPEPITPTVEVVALRPSTQTINYEFSAITIPITRTPLILNQPVKVVESYVEENQLVSVDEPLFKVQFANLTHQIIQSPLEGYVVELAIDINQWTSPNKPLAWIESKTTQLKGLMDAQLLNQIKLDQLSFDYQDQQIKLTNFYIAQPQSLASLVEFRATYDDIIPAYESIKLTMFKEDVSGIWIDAHLIYINSDPKVKLVVNNRVIERKVTIIQSYNLQVLVEGLASNEYLITSQNKDIKPLQKVNIIFKEQHD